MEFEIKQKIDKPNFNENLLTDLELNKLTKILKNHIDIICSSENHFSFLLFNSIECTQYARNWKEK